MCKCDQQKKTSSPRGADPSVTGRWGVARGKGFFFSFVKVKVWSLWIFGHMRKRSCLEFEPLRYYGKVCKASSLLGTQFLDYCMLRIRKNYEKSSLLTTPRVLLGVWTENDNASELECLSWVGPMASYFISGIQKTRALSFTIAHSTYFIYTGTELWTEDQCSGQTHLIYIYLYTFTTLLLKIQSLHRHLDIGLPLYRLQTDS